MHKIDGDGATQNNEFTEEDASTGTPPTVVTADWLNDVQGNLINALKSMGITPEKLNYDQLAAGIRGVGLKNGLINGGFDVWQRGTSFSNVAYSADRWGHSSAPSQDVTRQDFALGQTDVPGNPKHFMRINRTAVAGSSQSVLYQRIEGVRSYGGDKAVFSFWAKFDSGKEFVLRALQSFGTGGTPSAGVSTDFGTITGTGAWEHYAVAVDVPSTSGKTVGTDGNDFLQLEIREETSLSTFTLDIAEAQVERGAEASSREQRPLALELVLCQRYYETTYDLDEAPGDSKGGAWGLLSGASHARAAVPFKVRKRAKPSVTIYDAQGNPGQATAAGTNHPGSVDFISEYRCRAGVTDSADASTSVAFQIAADAEL